MKDVTTIIKTGQLVGGGDEQKRGESGINEYARQNINAIFQRLQAIFPAWRNAYPTNEALEESKKIWVRALIESQVCTNDQIARGMVRARQHEGDFFPSVGKFISWCRLSAEDMGLPSARAAWLEVCNHSHHVLIHEWAHPAIYEAGRRAGWFDIRNGTMTEKQFAEVYAEVIDELAAGAEFKTPAPDANALEHHTSGSKVTTEEAKAAANAALDKLKWML